MKKLIALMVLLYSGSTFAAQCPSINQVLDNDQWILPTGWKKMALSPLAGDTGVHQVNIQGLTHVFYLKNQQQLRCTYNKKGHGIAANTFVITQSLENFKHAEKGAWTSLFQGTVWSCFHKTAQGQTMVIDPSQCQWN